MNCAKQSDGNILFRVVNATENKSKVTVSISKSIETEGKVAIPYLELSHKTIMDRHTPEQRHKNMQAVKNKDSEIERMLRAELWKRGMRYRKNVRKIMGNPDIAFIGKKIAVFCDSEFWHGYDWENHKNDIKSNKDFWIQKIERNMQRDIEVTESLRADGWIVLRFWGKDIKQHTSDCADKIQQVWEAR